LFRISGPVSSTNKTDHYNILYKYILAERRAKFYLPLEANTTLYGIPKDKYPCDGQKAEKNKNW
jgi:hypothetical protein